MKPAEPTQTRASAREEALTTLAAAGIGAAFLDNAGRIIASNTPIESWIGRSASDIAGKMFVDILPAETASSASDGFNSLLLGQRSSFTFTGPAASAGKRTKQVRQMVSRLQDQGEAFALLVATEAELEAGVRAEARAFRAALDATYDPVIICDAAGRVCYVNSAFELETGCQSEDAVGKDLLSLFDGDDPGCSELMDSVSAKVRWRGKVALRSSRGSLPPETAVSFPVTDEQGQVEHVVTAKRQSSDSVRFEERLMRLAHLDPVTGLPNRLLFGDQVKRKLAEARRYGDQVAILYIDLDRFKDVNEALGHTNGDLLLRAIAERLTNTLREVDMVARMGADEFTALLIHINDPTGAAIVADRVFTALSQPFTLAGREIYASASIGISRSPEDGDDVETLVKNADAAMRSAKATGRNAYEFYNSSHNASAMERITIEHKLPRALERSEFVLYYQPCQDVGTGRVLGSEALIRWQDPEQGLVSPGVFIPVAEDTGLIVPITEYVLREACARNKNWMDRGLGPLEVAVNISSRLFQLRSFPATLRATLAETGMDPRHLVLELTEYMLMQDPGKATGVLEEMKTIGVRLALDDFGTGYSSLSYLKNFPIDTLKIDRSFISGVPDNTSDAAIAEAVIAMAHSLRMDVIAEGVETIEQFEFLRDRGCDMVQGYFISQPAPPEEFEALIARRETAGAMPEAA